MKNFVAIDFETAQGPRWSACAIGIIRVESGYIVEKFYSLIQPPNNEYNQQNINKHGITPNMTLSRPFFSEIFPIIKTYINGSLIVAHNMAFDLDVLRSSADFYKIDKSGIKFQTDCTYSIFKEKLNICCEKYNIKIDHHDPLSDAEACARLYLLHLGLDPNVKPKIHDSNNFKSNIPKDNRERIKGNVLVPNIEPVEDKENPFFNKKVVISGTYKNWTNRIWLADLMKELGADVDSTVSKKTNYLLAGDGVGPNKLEKMEQNILAGNEAFVLTEPELLSKLDKIVLNKTEDDKFIRIRWINIQNDKFYITTSSKIKPRKH